MAASKARKQAGGRWWWWPFGFALVAVVGLSLLRWLVQPERLGRLLLEQARQASGLDLEVATPPRLGIWPRLHLQLGGLVVRDPAVPGVTLARAEHVALYLPLSTLRGEVTIDAIAIQAPQLALGELERWSAAQMGPPGAAWLPPVSLLEIRDGSVAGSGWTLDGIDIDLQHLLGTAPMSLDLTARLLPGQGEPLPLALQMEAENPPPDSPLAWQVRSLSIGDGRSAWLSEMRGSLRLPEWSAASASLGGAVQAWPSGWPRLPASLTSQIDALQLQIELDPRDAQAALRVSAEGEGRQARFALHPTELARWISDGDWLAPPPVSGELSAQRIEIDGVIIEGLEIRHALDAER